MKKARKFCIHNKRKDNCVTCTPSLSCDHKARKLNCKICSPTSTTFCKHGWKKDCRLCDPTILCEHKIIKRRCRLCNPDAHCEHRIRRSRCQLCSPDILCEHNVLRNICYFCAPELWATESIRHLIKQAKYRGHKAPIITIQELLDLSNNINCFLCEKPMDWNNRGDGREGPVLHHNHDTGKVYGYVHDYCNKAEGHILKIAKFGGNLEVFFNNVFRDLIRT